MSDQAIEHGHGAHGHAAHGVHESEHPGWQVYTLVAVVLIVLTLRKAPVQNAVNLALEFMASFGGGCSAQLVPEEPVEGLGQLAAHAVVVVDQDPAEERVVELSTKPIRRFLVGATTIAHAS